MDLTIKQRATRDAKIFLLTQAAKSGISVSQNEYSKVLNLKVNRETKFTIKDIFHHYWNNFVECCKKKNITIRPAIIENVDKLIK